MKRLSDRIAALSLVAVLVATLVLLVLPIVVAIAMSFDGASYLTPFPPHSYSLHWYRGFFSNNYYITGLRVSALLAVLATLISTTVGTAVAVAFHRYEFRGKALLSAAFMSPMVVGGVVVGFSLLMFLSRLHIDSGLLRLLAGHIIITLPFTIRSSLASLAGISPRLEEAALSLGANERRAFVDITLPLAKTGIIAGSVFAFAFSMDEVAASMFLTTTRVYSLPIALISMMRSNFNLTIAAAAVMLLAVTVVLIVILDRVVGMDRVVGQGTYGG